MAKFAQSQEESAFAVASLKTRLDELQIAFGKAMLGADSASSAVQRFELVVADMTTEVNDSASGLNMIFKTTVRVIEALLLTALQETHQQLRNLTATIDIIQITIFRFTQNLSLAASALDQVIRRINAVVDSDVLASFSDGVRRISMELESDAPTIYTLQLDHAANSVTHFTSRMADALVGTQALNDELSAMKAAQKATRGVIKTAKDVKTRGRGGGGGRRKGSQVPAWMQIEIDKADLMYETWKEETTQAEDRPLGAMAGTMASSLGATMPIITAQVAALKAEIDALNAAAAASNKVWTDLANGGISLAFESVAGMTQALIEGGDALQAFGAGLLSSLGDLLTQAGMAFVMMGTGVENIKLGITAPGALIAIGVGMLALGGALKGFATRAQPGGGGGGGDGGKTAQALQRFGRQLFDRQMGQESREVMINIEGRQMRGYVLDVASDGLRTGSIPLTPVRRR
jgi:hypothetical protein